MRWRWASASFAQARPISAYRGTIGDAAVEVMLIHDWQLDGMSGYMVAADGAPVPLEKTPYSADAPLLLNALDDPGLPGRTLVLQPFAPGARTVVGRALDLRSRLQQPLRLQRETLFSSEPRHAYDGELLQIGADARFLFRVHAHKRAGAHLGRVDRITVIDRATREVAQVIDGVEIVFFGGETLGFADINGDGVLDFKVTPLHPDDRERGAEHVATDRVRVLHDPLGLHRRERTNDGGRRERVPRVGEPTREDVVVEVRRDGIRDQHAADR